MKPVPALNPTATEEDSKSVFRYMAHSCLLSPNQLLSMDWNMNVSNVCNLLNSGSVCYSYPGNESSRLLAGPYSSGHHSGTKPLTCEPLKDTLKPQPT